MAQLAAALGVPLMPWQRHVLDIGLQRRGNRFRYQRVIVHTSRRSGKSTLTFLMQAHRALAMPRSSIWYGAQSRKDGLEIWDQQLNEHLVPHKDRLRFKPRQSVGSESLRFENGSRISLFTPAESSLVGLSTDLVTVDEARFHSMTRGLALEAGIRPTQATRDGQLWIVSSAGTFGQSDWLWSWLEKGRESLDDPDSPIAFFDYSIPEDGDPLDIDLVAAHHPAIGHTVNREFLVAEAATMDPYDFAREYAGQWTKATEQLIPQHDWNAGANPKRPMPKPGTLAVGFATTPTRSSGAIAGAWRDDTGRPHVALLDCRPGVDWIDERVRALTSKWSPVAVGYNRVGPAVSIADGLTRAKVKLTPLGSNEYVVACGSFYEAILARSIVHHDQADLNEAVAGVAKRNLGERWVWGHNASSASIAPLEAATVAAWALDHQPTKVKQAVVTLDG